MGNRLRKFKKEVSGLGGAVKLTDSMVDRSQNYYGIAIRSSVGDLPKMKKAIGAVLFHCASSKENEWHSNCPKGSDSWCKYQQDISNKTTTYVSGPGLPKSVILHVKPIFVELSEDALLEKCLHGETQNQNESFNGIIWQRIPEDVCVNAATFEMGVYDALSHFNLGNIATVNIYNYFGFHSGYYTLFALDCNNKKRVNNSIRKSSEVYIN